MTMKNTILLSSVATALLLTSSVCALDIVKPPVEQSQQAPQFADNEVIITLKEGQSSKSFLKLLDKQLGLHTYTTHQYSLINAIHLKSKLIKTDALIKILKNPIFESFVKVVTPNYAMSPMSSNDVHYNKLWAIENVGQEVNDKKGTVDADMDVAEAWDIDKGNRDVVVAVLDTGVDYTHNDLQDNMWTGNAKHGYDFAGDDDGNNDDDPMPDQPYDKKGHYHGTHVAGTIGAVGDNGIGVSGVAQEVSIMAVKVFRPKGYAYNSDILEGLDYVAKKIDEGENIVAINASYGGDNGSQDDAVNDAIKKLGEKGLIFCAAAGNSSKDIDKKPSYPASYDAPNIITVAASDQDDKLASFSNYGKKSVDVAAPGTNILSTYPENKYAYLNGTSMATPNVVGTVALVASVYPNASVEERKAIILDNVDKKSTLQDKVLTDGRVNVNKALGGEDTSTNHAPVANDDQVSTSYEKSKLIDVLENDTDADNDILSIESFTQPEHGTTELKDGKIEYTPNKKYSGDDTFTYTITDGKETSTATVNVTVKEKSIFDILLGLLGL
jgi:subtilisin family serine protease